MNPVDTIEKGIILGTPAIEFAGPTNLRLYSKEDGCVIGYYTVDFEPILQSTFFAVIERFTEHYPHLTVLASPKLDPSLGEPIYACSNQRWSPFLPKSFRDIETDDVNNLPKTLSCFDLNHVTRSAFRDELIPFKSNETTFTKIMELSSRYAHLLAEGAKQREGLRQNSAGVWPGYIPNNPGNR